jgi:SAM-dependent methyltransferase
MNQETVSFLNDINRHFYHHHAEEFGATRRSPWRGWARLVEHLNRLALPAELSVLDVGCGNGRFALYLREHYSKPFTYIGMDVSAKALEAARAQLPNKSQFTLIEHDLVAGEQILPSQAPDAFSLIVVFGLLHHIPGHDRRQALLAELARRLDYQGILAISIWQFGRFERFQKKIIPWGDLQTRTGVEIDPSQLEPGDTLLSWGTEPAACRYCHFMDSEEATRLVSTLPLDCFDTFSADGATHNLNQYYLMRCSRTASKVSASEGDLSVR